VSQNFVTPKELDQRLAGYEKLGTSDTICGELEEKIKKSVRATLESSHVQLTALIEDRAGQLFNRLDSHVKKYMDNLSVQIQESALKSLSSGLEKAKRDIELDLNLVIKSKTQEAFSQLNLSQKGFEATMEKVFWSKLDNFDSQLRNEMQDFEKIWIDKATSMTSNAVEEVKDSVASQSHSLISSHLLSVGKIVEELRADLSHEMSKKLVDKQAIEQKMREIEADLTKKAQSVIDFNISQARQNMEQAARAELEEGIKSAAGKIMSGLT
jgi:hypothetical protein